MHVSAAGSGTSRMPWVSVVAALVVPLVVTSVAHVVDPDAQRRVRVDAIAVDVDRVREAWLNDGMGQSCGNEEWAHAAVAEGDSTWRRGACWERAGVDHTADHALWVVGAADDFAVHGIADIDGDGVVVEFVATRARPAERWTPPDVM
jgi:hypothetical protein